MWVVKVVSLREKMPLLSKYGKKLYGLDTFFSFISTHPSQESAYYCMNMVSYPWFNEQVQ